MSMVKLIGDCGHSSKSKLIHTVISFLVFKLSMPHLFADNQLIFIIAMYK